MREPVEVPRSEHKAPAQLKWVSAELLLLEPARLCTLPRHRIIRSQQVKHTCGPQPRCFVRDSLFVDQQWERDPGVFAKDTRVGSVAQTDRGEIRTLGSELGFVCAQLRDVLAAEDSAIVAQENDHRWRRFPQRSQAPGFPI
jgi:hypothetical protein